MICSMMSSYLKEDEGETDVEKETKEENRLV